MRIKNKAEMYELYFAGAFGNRLEAWANLDDYLSSDSDKRVVLRYKGGIGGAWVRYNVARSDVGRIVSGWISEGADRRLITLNESAPDEELILQGEVMRSINHIDLRFSRLKLPMRQALAIEQHHISGLQALFTLMSQMDPSSYEDLQVLLDDYEDAVVEFSIWGRNVGNLPFRNTVFWEVRNY